MKIAVTATGPDLEAKVDPRFGRCSHFLIVETDDLSFEAVENPNVALGGGAGIQSARMMAEKGVKHVLTGNCGPNAHQTLSAAGVGVIVGCSGPVREVIEQYKAGRLWPVAEPNVAGHFGMGVASAGPANPAGSRGATFGRSMGRGAGRGMGGGRGMGMGGGRGMGTGGMGRGRGMGFARGGMGPGAAFPQRPAPTPQQSSPGLSTSDELAKLKRQAEAINQQMQQIQQRMQQVQQDDDRQTVAAPKVNQELCTGCGSCIEVCQAGAISLRDGRAVIDAEACVGCGACVDACPCQAISPD